MRLSAGTLIILIVGVLAAIGGAMLLKEYLKEEPVAATPPPPPTFAIALGDLQPGRVLTVGDIGLVREPNLIAALERQAEAQSNGAEDVTSPYLRQRLDEEGNPIEGAYALSLPMDTLTSPQDLIGRRVKDNIPAGTPFQASFLYPEGYRPALTTEVKDGRGIYTVGITNFLPGDQDVRNLRADVLFRNNPMNDIPGFDPIPEQTVVLVRDARILEAGEPYVADAYGQATDSGGSATRGREQALTDVTLAVSIEDGAKLLTAQDNGDLTLVLYSDDSDAGTEISTTDDAVASVKLTDFLQATPTPPAEIEIEPYDTTIFRGTDGFSNNSFAFNDLLRELQEVGAIEIKMDPKATDDPNPAVVTVPLNQPSNSGQRNSGAGTNASTAGLDTAGNVGSGGAVDSGGGGGSAVGSGGGG